MDIGDIIDSEDLCAEILTLVINGLSENEDEIHDLLDKCNSIVDVALNVVPVVKKILDETLTESIKPYASDNRGDDGSVGQDEESVGIPQAFEIEDFIPICQQYAGTNKDIRDMLRSLEKSFVPIKKELLENSSDV
jgi:hypothetical protein